MGQHAENDGDHTTDAANEPEPYDDEPYDHEVYDDEVYDADVDGAAREGVTGPPDDRGPDVFLDVPRLKVDELDLDVENLRAHVSLQAEVLDLLKLNVGADVALGQVHLGISGVEAEARLKVRLDNVAQIINRVLTTLDRNPQILEDLARGVGSAVHDVGRGAATAVRDVGEGTGSAVEDVGGGAGEAVGEVVQGVAGSAGQAVGEVGDTVRETGRAAGRSAGRAVGESGPVEAAGQPGGRSGPRRRRVPNDVAGATRSVRRRGGRQRGEPP
ncbi:hypothetical protein ACFUIW_31080 [Streptomyces sp. NPDC057245]|uniref:hypothetical protein n=1 Tax=Streptomyces sp. NPDC057245 TaxID=3346065 RepID=UPI00362A5A50